jgi:hypothetical protein
MYTRVSQIWGFGSKHIHCGSLVGNFAKADISSLESVGGVVSGSAVAVLAFRIFEADIYTSSVLLGMLAYRDLHCIYLLLERVGPE